jgi:signal transduction histidine kinase
MLAPYPRTVWGPAASLLVLVALGTPVMIRMAISSPGSTDVLTGTALLIAACACVLAAAALYFASRVTGVPDLAWMVLCLTVYGVGSMAVALLRAGSGEFRRPGWLLLLDLTVALAIAVVAVVVRGQELRTDPLALGIGIGAVVALAHLELQQGAPSITWGPFASVIGLAVLVLSAFAALRLVRRCVLLPLWMTQRVGLGFVLLATGRTAAVQDVSGAVANGLVAAAMISGAVLLLSSTLAVLRSEILRHRARLAELDARVALMDARDVEQRSRLHEITNSVAGIAGASRLIHHGTHLPQETRAHFEEMLESESARLARILARDSDPAPGPGTRRLLALDDVIRPLVAAQLAVGRRVAWTPSGDTAVGDPDDVTEALNVLLDNARKHAPGGTTTVMVRSTGTHVEIVVADDGPGLDRRDREHAFTAGARGPRSRGQGLGLHLARERLGHCEGSIELAPARRGAAFVVRLPARVDDDPGPAVVRAAQ